MPVTGSSAELGLSMQRASGLAQSAADEKTLLTLFDTSDTPEAAARAAAKAVAQGAPAILGPVFAAQTAAVAAAVAGRVSVVSFSNSPAPAGSGIFSFGITPSQSVSAILQYARARGVRRVALIGSGSTWSDEAKRAAQRVGPEIGLTLVDVPALNGSADAVQTLQGLAGGLPDAALFTGGPADFAAIAQPLQRGGVQVLGTLQALDQPAAGRAALEGAWLSAPDPAAFARFAQAYAPAGKPPGVIAALAYDAARIAGELAAAGTLNREGLLRPAGFGGITGAVRFRPDGRCVREMAIVTVASGVLKTVARKAGV